MDEKVHGREPKRFPAFDPCESAMEPGGQITCWIGFSEVLSWLVAAGRPTPLDQQTKGGHWLQLEWGGFFSPPMESPVLNRVWLAELCSTPIWEWGPTGVRVQHNLTRAVGKRQARCPHNLPTALSPTVPLNLPKGRTTSPGMTGWERLYGWEKERKRRWRWAGGQR